MWNILIVLIIAAVIWMIAPSANFMPTPKNNTSIKQSDIDKIKDDATSQVDYARQMQKQEQQQDNSNNQ